MTIDFDKRVRDALADKAIIPILWGDEWMRDDLDLDFDHGLLGRAHQAAQRAGYTLEHDEEGCLYLVTLESDEDGCLYLAVRREAHGHDADPIPY